jgi:hypothetical protein
MSEQFRKFYDDLILLVGEVPTPALVEKVAAEIGPDPAERCRMMGYLAFSAKCFGQSDEALDLHARDAFLDLIVALSKET